MSQAGSAVVLGASISGLLAARALSSHVARVTIVERDVVPPSSLMAPTLAWRVLARRLPRDSGTPWGTLEARTPEPAA
jgi:flavin-dependent dehydrogenase